MPAPTLQWYETDGTTIAGIDTYTPVAGTPTAAQTTRLYNDHLGTAAADDATELRVTAVSRDAGDPNFTAEHGIAAGGYVEVRAVGSGGTGVLAQTTEWTPIGKGRYLYLRDLPSNCYRTIETRVNAPAGYGTVAVEVLLRAVAASPSVALEDGHAESGATGVAHLVGDGRGTVLLEGGVVTASGSPDANVNLNPTTYIAGGVPWTLAAQTVALNNLDSAAAALASGESYLAAITLAADGSITQTKSAKGTSPLPVSSRPTPPSDEVFLSWVEREFDATISSGNINQADKVFGWFKVESSGLVATVHPGSALIDNSLVTFTGKNALTLTASSTNRIWLNASGTFSVTTTAARPQDRSLLLWICVTDGSGVTSTVDRRSFTGRPIHAMHFDKAGTLAATDFATSAWPFAGLGYIFPTAGVILALGTAGATSGATTVDLEQSDAGAGYVTVYTDQTLRPSIAFGASNPITSAARNQVYAVQPFSRWKAIVDAVPGTASTYLSVTVLVVEADS